MIFSITAFFDDGDTVRETIFEDNTHTMSEIAKRMAVVKQVADDLQHPTGHAEPRCLDKMEIKIVDTGYERR